VLRRELRANAVNDEKFEILKDAAKTGDLGRIDDAFFILKPRIGISVYYRSLELKWKTS
jgi:hypothetical protein